MQTKSKIREDAKEVELNDLMTGDAAEERKLGDRPPAVIPSKISL